MTSPFEDRIEIKVDPIGEPFTDRQLDAFKNRKTDELSPVDAQTPGERARDRTREVITLWLLGLLCVVVGFSFLALFLDAHRNSHEEHFKNLKSLLDVLVGPIITLLSSAIGFYFGYFGSQAGRNSADRRGKPRQ